MATSLTLYFQSVNASSTISTANALIENGTTTASNATKTSTVASGTTGWGEVFSQGTTNAWAAAGSAPSPSGNGFCNDNATLLGNQFVSGTWTANVRDNLSTGTATVDLHVRAYRRSSGGVYTLIADMVSSSASLTSSQTNYTCTATGVAASGNFNTGDTLYIDVIWNIISSSSGLNAKIQESTVSTQGYTNAQVVTPGYQLSPVVKHIVNDGYGGVFS